MDLRARKGGERGLHIAPDVDAASTRFVRVALVGALYEAEEGRRGRERSATPPLLAALGPPRPDPHLTCWAAGTVAEEKESKWGEGGGGEEESMRREGGRSAREGQRLGFWGEQGWGY
jgi:hypothetical protein